MIARDQAYGDTRPGRGRAPWAAQRNSLSPAVRDFSAGPSLERSNVSQALIDIGAALMAFLFICITGVGISAALFILLFVSVRSFSGCCR